MAGKQLWLGPARSGITVTFWADTEVIHLLIAGTWLKSTRSHLSVNDLAALRRNGGRPAGPVGFVNSVRAVTCGFVRGAPGR